MSSYGTYTFTDYEVGPEVKTRKVVTIPIPFGADKTFDMGAQLQEIEWEIWCPPNVSGTNLEILFNEGSKQMLVLDEDGINTEVQPVSLSKTNVLPNVWKYTMRCKCLCV